MTISDKELKKQIRVSDWVSRGVGIIGGLVVIAVTAYSTMLTTSCVHEKTIARVITKTSNADTVTNITVMEMTDGEISVKHGIDFQPGDKVCVKQVTRNRFFD